MGTLKAEMSQLRDILGGLHVHIVYLYTLKPIFYKLNRCGICSFSFAALHRCISAESPFLCAWRDCLESRLSFLKHKKQIYYLSI